MKTYILNVCDKIDCKRKNIMDIRFKFQRDASATWGLEGWEYERMGNIRGWHIGDEDIQYLNEIQF